MSTRFLLVRHATCSPSDTVLLGRLVDPPLDAHGQRQACALACRIARERPQCILASPRRRTRETAQIIAAHCRCGWRVDDELDEMDFGAWSGHTFIELQLDPAWRKWNAQRDGSSTPAGDTIHGVQMRIAAYLERLRQSCRETTLVLVTHAEVIRSALLHFRGLPVDDYHYVDVPTASMNVLRADGPRIHLEVRRANLAASRGMPT